jgi:hypothetical protein
MSSEGHLNETGKALHVTQRASEALVVKASFCIGKRHCWVWWPTSSGQIKAWRSAWVGGGTFCKRLENRGGRMGRHGDVGHACEGTKRD